MQGRAGASLDAFIVRTPFRRRDTTHRWPVVAVRRSVLCHFVYGRFLHGGERKKTGDRRDGRRGQRKIRIRRISIRRFLIGGPAGGRPTVGGGRFPRWTFG